MDNPTTTQWAAMWRKQPGQITRHLACEGDVLQTAEGGKIRLLWNTLEDVVPGDTFAEVAQLFLSKLARVDQPARAALVANLVVGHASDLVDHPDRARRSWDLGVAWAHALWGDPGVRIAGDTVKRLIAPGQEHADVLAYVLADVARRHQGDLLDDKPWIWAWLDHACTWGRRMGPCLELLVRAGLDVDHPNEVGRTPLMTVGARLSTLGNQRKRHAWGGGQREQEALEDTMSLLVAAGADWQRLDLHTNTRVGACIERHPRVRAARLGAMLGDPGVALETESEPRAL